MRHSAQELCPICCTGFNSLRKAGPARDPAQLPRVYQPHPDWPDGQTKLQYSQGSTNGPARAGPLVRSSQVPRPSTGPAWSNALSTAPGSTVLTWPAQHGSSSHYLWFISSIWSGPSDQVTRLGQGSTAPPQGSARQAHYTRFIGPAPGRPGSTRAGFYGPHYNYIIIFVLCRNCID